MKGTLTRTENSWVIKYWEKDPHFFGPPGTIKEIVKEAKLHPNTIWWLGEQKGKPGAYMDGEEVEFEFIKDEKDPLGPDEGYAKIVIKEEPVTPMVERLREHLASITPEEFKKEWEEIETMGFGNYCASKEKNRTDKLESLAKIFAKIMYYGDWKWETPNERVVQMLMTELGYYPFRDEDEMIANTQVDENLYKQANDKVPTR